MTIPEPTMKLFVTCAYACLLPTLLLGLPGRQVYAQAQEPGHPPLYVSGFSRMYFETSDHQRPGTQIPKTLFRWELEPTFFVYTVPFSLNLLYSTEDSQIGTDINGLALRFSFGTEKLEELVRQRINARIATLAEETGAAAARAEVEQLASTGEQYLTQAEQLASRSCRFWAGRPRWSPCAPTRRCSKSVISTRRFSSTHFVPENSNRVAMRGSSRLR